METVAHVLCALRIADLGFRERIGPRAGLVAVVAANSPDLDLILQFADRDRWIWWHRGVTHSFAGWPFMALLGAAASRRFAGGRYRDHLALWGLALLSHGLFDWTTLWGTMLFLPLSDVRFHLDWCYIVDPMFWVCLAGVPALLRWRLGRERAARWGLGAMLGWVLACGMAHEAALGAMREASGHLGEVYPAPAAPLNWTGVTFAGQLERWWLTPWSASPAGAWPAPDYGAFAETEVGARFAWMARAPVLLAREPLPDGGERLRIADLAFTTAWWPERFPRVGTFTLDAQGRVVDFDW